MRQVSFLWISSLRRQQWNLTSISKHQGVWKVTSVEFVPQQKCLNCWSSMTSGHTQYSFHWRHHRLWVYSSAKQILQFWPVRTPVHWCWGMSLYFGSHDDCTLNCMFSINLWLPWHESCLCRFLPATPDTRLHSLVLDHLGILYLSMAISLVMV